ncbi:MAG TPA: class I SAM-dependent RNA methyltransferase [Streptosporangiaceae bacterium]|jgi:tRNA/tmRNA/rRNA uracil-C5-methylase (TrmA/RlmC/RlmD family)
MEAKARRPARPRPPARPDDAGTVLDLTVSDVAHGGWCVARDPGGRVVFVRHALPGERVRAKITQSGAKFARADAVEILTASPDRVEPPCPHARPGGCGGCDWQHATLPAQRRLKAEVVRRQLQRIAGIDREVTVEPLAPGETGLDWRTRVRYSVAPDGTAGLLAHRSHTVVDVGDCPIAHPLVRAAGVPGLRWERTGSVEVVVSPGPGERAAIVAGPPAAGRRAAALLAGRADTVLVGGRGGRLTTVTGRGYLRRAAAGRSWRVGAGAFWQVHPAAPAVLTEAVLAALGPQPGEVALDLYCGAGLFAGALAGAVGPGGTVIGVDSDRAAVRDARHNLRRVPWARIHAGDVAAVLSRGGWPQASLAVLDPPRTGAARTVLAQLLASPAGGQPQPGGRSGGDRRPGLRKVAYVSCDPATLARDIAVFAQAGWQLDALRAFDAFPMTHHVECVATLSPG